MTEVEVRCPVGPRKLFTKLKLGEETGGYLPGNLLEISCADCRRRLSREWALRLSLVVHRYNFIGELQETAVVHVDGREEVLPTV